MRQRHRRRSPRTVIAAAAIPFILSLVAGGVTACEVRLGRGVDTVAVVQRLVDTIQRVDTVFRAVDVAAGVLAPDSATDSASGTPKSSRASSSAPVDARVTDGDVNYLRSRRLLLPVAGIRGAQLLNTFDESRSAGRRHDALDILAPRGTAVLSTDAGRVVMIDTSVRGGLSLYATDPTGTFVYYYAHLDRYARGVVEGLPLRRGDTVGYVGTTGNAPPNTPHLHFAINKLTTPDRWWDGLAINPYPLLHDGR